MGLFLIDLGVSTAQLPAATTETGLLTFFASAAGVRVAVDVLGLASAGGLFVVPLFAAIQADAPPAWRARLVAAVNVLNSTFIVAGVAATAILQSAAIGLSEPVLSILLGVLTVAFALYVRRCVAPAPVKT